MPGSKSEHRRKIFGQRTRGRRYVPISALVIIAMLALLAVIRPSRSILDINPANVLFSTPTPLQTAIPRPTDAHGGHIVFTCTRKDINQICVIAPDGTGYQQLTDGNANTYYPAISATGTDAVFAVNQNDVFDLYRLALDVNAGPRQSRSRLKQLTDNIGNTFGPQFSPDGREIAFLNQDGEVPSAIWLMEADGQQPRQVYAGRSPIVALAWSPDGRRMAFCMSVEATFSYEVFILDLESSGAAPIQVSHGLHEIGGSIGWSPTGDNLLLFAGPAAAREIFRLELSDGIATQLTHGGNNASPAYSPDGEYIVFNSLRNGGQADLFVMRADGHSTRQLTDFPEPDWQPEWGP